MDHLGRLHAELARGGGPIPFPHRRVVPVSTGGVRAAGDAHAVQARFAGPWTHGTASTVAENYVEYQVTREYPPAREQITSGEEILRAAPGDWWAADWSEGAGERQAATDADSCHGAGSGYFEWSLPTDGTRWWEARRLRVLFEASSRRRDTPQTSLDLFFPSALRILLNGLLIPHMRVAGPSARCARGVKLPARGQRVRMANLEQVVVEGDLLRRVREARRGGHVRLRFEVPPDVPRAQRPDTLWPRNPGGTRSDHQ